MLEERAEQSRIEVRARRDEAERGVRGAAAGLGVARQREHGGGGDTARPRDRPVKGNGVGSVLLFIRLTRKGRKFAV